MIGIKSGYIFLSFVRTTCSSSSGTNTFNIWKIKLNSKTSLNLIFQNFQPTHLARKIGLPNPPSKINYH